MLLIKLIGTISAAACIVSASKTTQLSPSKLPVMEFAIRPANTPNSDAQSLFDYSMALNDARFDETYKYIIYEDDGPWSVRFTSWYVPGLLFRNTGKDVENAKEAINNM